MKKRMFYMKKAVFFGVPWRWHADTPNSCEFSYKNLVFSYENRGFSYKNRVFL
jgi:hypothetical protein